MPESLPIPPEADVTDVVARLRALGPGEIRLIVPQGAALAGSRFNFQLLAMQSAENGQRLVVESDDPRTLGFAEASGMVTRDAAPGPAGGPFPAATHDEEYADYVEYDDHGMPVHDAPEPYEPDPYGADPYEPDPYEPDPYGPDPSAADPYAADAGAPADEDLEPEPAAPPEWSGAGARGGPWRPESSAWGASAGRAGGRRRLALYSGAVAILLLGIVAVILFVPSATITLTVPSKAFAEPVDLTAQPGSGGTGITVRTQSASKQASATFPATGQHNTPGAEATGSIQYTFAKLCAQVVKGDKLSIPNGSTLVSKSGVVFVQQQAVTLSFHQSASAPIKAQAVGANGNVDAGQITQLQNGGSSAGCLQVTNPKPTTGGQDAKHQTVISKQDLTSAQAQLEQQVQQAVQQQLASDAQQNEKQADSNPIIWGAVDFTADHAQGASVPSFNATLTQEGTSAYYRPGQVSSAFRAVLLSKVPAGQQLTPGYFTARYSAAGSSGGRLEFTGQAAGRIAPKLNLDAIRSKVTAHTTSSANGYLQTLPVSGASVSEFPMPLPMMPLLGDRITIRYVIQQPPPTLPSPGPSASPAATAH